VEFGRYTDAKEEIGYDGFWKSPETEFCIVVEVKTSEVYPVKTATLTNYVDELISDGEIRTWDTALGI
jgi:hypothetical protein